MNTRYILLTNLILIFSTSLTFAQYQYNWSLSNSNVYPGERVIAIIDAGAAGNYEGIGIIGEVVDDNGNWGQALPRRSDFQMHLRFSYGMSYKIVQDRETPNIVLRLRKISDRICHLTANVSSNHKSVSVNFDVVISNGIESFTLGSTTTINDSGDLVIPQPAYESSFSGNVGFGTTNPSYKIDVNGGNFYVKGTNRDWGGARGLGTHIGTGDFDIYSGNPGSGTHRLRVSNAGNVGIGTTTPSQKLSVAGTINSEEIIVEENVGADFVFEASYELLNLQDIEAFIEQNQHLPGIAPASQMIEEGVKVGELQMQLLQKIEELTLYTIEQEKKIEAHKNENESLMMLIKDLSQRIKHLEEHEN